MPAERCFCSFGYFARSCVVGPSVDHKVTRHSTATHGHRSSLRSITRTWTQNIRRSPQGCEVGCRRRRRKLALHYQRSHPTVGGQGGFIMANTADLWSLWIFAWPKRVGEQSAAVVVRHARVVILTAVLCSRRLASLIVHANWPQSRTACIVLWRVTARKERLQRRVVEGNEKSSVSNYERTRR